MRRPRTPVAHGAVRAALAPGEAAQAVRPAPPPEAPEESELLVGSSALTSEPTRLPSLVLGAAEVGRPASRRWVSPKPPARRDLVWQNP